jgi:hypothetical protein
MIIQIGRKVSLFGRGRIGGRVGGDRDGHERRYRDLAAGPAPACSSKIGIGLAASSGCGSGESGPLFLIVCLALLPGAAPENRVFAHLRIRAKQLKNHDSRR